MTLPSNMLYYKEQFMHFSKLGFITRPKYLDTFLSNALRVAIGQLKISSHQLEIENNRTDRVLREERICRLCHIEIEDEYSELLTLTPKIIPSRNIVQRPSDFPPILLMLSLLAQHLLFLVRCYRHHYHCQHLEVSLCILILVRIDFGRSSSLF